MNKEDTMENKTDFTQNREDKAEFQNVFFMKLLFTEKPVRPDVDVIHHALMKKFGEVDIVCPEGLYSYAIKKYEVEYKDAAKVPAQVTMAEPSEFDPASIDAFTRSQFWDVPDGNELLDSCRYQVMIFDFMSAGLPYKQRCDLLMDWLETALSLFPDCTAVYTDASGKLFLADQVRNHQIPRKDRFLYFCVNARFFNIQGTEDSVVDTLGMYAIDLPDVQYHFHGLDPNHVVNHAYNAAGYIFDNNAPIKSGETIDGLYKGALSQRVQWPCRYEDALIQPVRCVMDICPNEYAAGKRG